MSCSPFDLRITSSRSCPIRAAPGGSQSGTASRGLEELTASHGGRAVPLREEEIPAPSVSSRPGFEPSAAALWAGCGSTARLQFLTWASTWRRSESGSSLRK